MYCRNCGTLLTDDAKFCASCGTSTAANKPQQSNSEEQAWISMPHTSLDGFANKIQNLANNSSIPAKIHMTGANLLLVVNGIIMVIMAIILAYAIISGCGDVLEVINLYNDEVAIIGSILLIVFGICYIYTAAMPAIFTVINILAPKKETVGAAWRACIIFIAYAFIMWVGSETFNEPSLMGDSLSGILYFSFGVYGVLLEKTLIPGLLALLCTSAAFYFSGARSINDYINALNSRKVTTIDFRKIFSNHNTSEQK
ncbi:hypothetical protein BSAE_1715 [Bifidobacterium pullorum subsp. saeculare DSM 6531 = LMG 14934]|uniref:Zinc-ribbon domain-containing protein n=1 Tax=Bifidobacterium pullorum subsp. saeculare DSM 6531 = LMG 14934 TaxID=1437611 RepID=A0A087CS65_9BIFI|nr:zinc ribbon domain-containing protein [Bifidobacterium pullorum]KFI86115.1 hypothetical protein BSAE_1715 [Bifidobacterium pullorum subsp. saeculare DSM 6531 = LMG 14934]